MNVRELLQKEIWSKKTSRKILIGFGIVVVGFCVWYALDRYWITPPERNAARVALAQIDALQKFNEMSDAEYDAGALQAKGKVDTAGQVAWTSRDEKIAAALEGYLGVTQVERSDQKQNFRDNNPEGENIHKANLHNSKIVRIFVGQVLHHALD
jgi:hypothetical protein